MIAGLESSGMTRTEIARKAGVSRMTVWRLAVGEGRSPLYETIHALENLSKNLARVNPVIQKR